MLKKAFTQDALKAIKAEFMGIIPKSSNSLHNGRVHHHSIDVKSNVESMLICFFDTEGIVH